MNLDHLDDPQPPTLGDDQWQQVRSVARTRRNRRRVAQSGVVSSVLVIGIAVAVVATRPSARPSVNVSATSSSAASSTTAALPASVWVTTEVHVDNPVVHQGDDVTGTVVFDNRTAHTVYLSDQCGHGWIAAVAPRGERPDVAVTADCRLLPRLEPGATVPAAMRDIVAPPGRTTVSFHASTRRNSCTGPGGSGVPRCLPDGSMPPFAAGPAQLWLVTAGSIAHLQIPSPIDITIVPAAVKGAIVMPDVIGMDPDAAQTLLRRAGFRDMVCWHEKVRIGTAVGVVVGTVMAQQPAAAAKVSVDEKVELTVNGTAPSTLEHCSIP